ncbi:MAG: 3-oxoacyl-ACP synthase, partial [Thermoleophilaceae bacterium]
MSAVGIVDIEAYAPGQVQTAEEIAAVSGIPADVIRNKFGLDRKHIAGPDEHVSVLAAKAATPLLARQRDGAIDALLYMGSPYRDFPVWSAAPKVQQLVAPSADGALAFDVQGVSAGTPISLRVAKGLILGDPRVRQVLLVGGSREHDLIDYENGRSRFMFTFGAGGAATLLRRDHPRNHVL